MADDFAAIGEAGAINRTSVTRFIARDDTPQGVPGRGEAARGEDPEAALAGTLVHRLFQFESTGWNQPRTIDDVVVQARRLCRAEEIATLERPDALLLRAASAYVGLRQRPDVQSVLMSGDCLFEVPFALALADGQAAGRTQIIRGAIDCLVRRPDGRVVVVDFKTGAPRAEHEAQLALYVRAARLLFATADVDGLLLYAGAP